MSETLSIRSAGKGDVIALLALYQHLTSNNEPFSRETAEDILDRFGLYEGSVILLGELDGEIVSSCAVIVVPNLTRGGAPFALIENVVTNATHGRRGFGRQILEAATAQAWDQGCYKVMLMTGSADRGTLAFYEDAGFAQTKTGFQKRKAVPAQHG